MSMMTPRSKSGGALRHLLGRVSRLFRPGAGSERTRRERRAGLRVEELEPRDVPSALSTLSTTGLVQFKFGPATAPVPAGYVKVPPTVLFNNTRGFGWQSLLGLSALDRGGANALTRSFERNTNDTFKVNVPNGTYTVTLIMGDETSARGQTAVLINGVAPSTEPPGGFTIPINTFIKPALTVQVTTGQIAISLVNAGSKTVPRWAVNAITVQAISLIANPGSQYTATLDTTTNQATINFSGSAVEPGVTDTSGFLFSWNFGDGGSDSGVDDTHPSHTYTAAGNYAVTLTVTDPNTGLSGSNSATAIIKGSRPGIFIFTPDLTIPDFAAEGTKAGLPTDMTVASGNWSDPSIWSLGRVPTTGDVVDITNGSTVKYDVVSTAALNTLEVQAGGTLNFATASNTELVVGNFLVLGASNTVQTPGTLTVGTTANPIASNVTATILIANQPLNLTNDPEQFGTGLIGLGNVTMCGASKNSTWVTLAAEPHAGDTTLKLASPAIGWQPGDELFLPDTRQLFGNDETSFINTGVVPNAQWELPTLTAVSADGLTLTLSAPLQFDHLGARDASGTLRFLPQVADFSSNVLIETQNGDNNPSIRGYTLFSDRADVDIRYVHFDDLGRTLINHVDNTVIDQNTGLVTHQGTNEGERVAITLDHLIGPMTPQANGHQYTLIGNSIGCDEAMNERWGIELNQAMFGLIQNNFIHFMQGAGLASIGGSEMGNVIDGNLAAAIGNFNLRADGRGGLNPSDEAFEGVGFWFRNFSNATTNNVATDVAHGFTNFAPFVNQQRVPPFQGAAESQYVQANLDDVPLSTFDNNEAYGCMAIGESLWFLGTLGDINGVFSDAQPSTLSNFKVWNVFDYGYWGYQENKMTISNYTALDTSTLANQQTLGLFFNDYLQKDLTITNADVEGFSNGFCGPQYPVGTLTISNSLFDNATNVSIHTPGSPSAGIGAGGIQRASTFVFSNDTFKLLTTNTGGAEYNIFMNYSTYNNAANVIVQEKVLVQNSTFFDLAGNQLSGSTFQVFFNEQAPDFVVPATTGGLVGAPAGTTLTNAQLFAMNGEAIAGAVLPTGTTTRADIFGQILLGA